VMASSVLSAASPSLAVSSSLSSRQTHKVPLFHCSHIGFNYFPFCDLTLLSNRGSPRLEATLWDLTMESNPSQMQGCVLKTKACCFNYIHLFLLLWLVHFDFVMINCVGPLGNQVGFCMWYLRCMLNGRCL